MDAAQIRRCVDACINERISFEKATIYYLLDALEQAQKEREDYTAMMREAIVYVREQRDAAIAQRDQAQKYAKAALTAALPHLLAAKDAELTAARALLAEALPLVRSRNDLGRAASVRDRIARAISAIKCDNVMEEDQHGCIASGSCHCLDYARAAIAAMSEREEKATHSVLEYVQPEPAPVMPADPAMTMAPGFDPGASQVDYTYRRPTPAASIRESERAACEAIAREREDKTAWNDYDAGELYAAGRIADAIAARKVIPSTGSHSLASPQDSSPKQS